MDVIKRGAYVPISREMALDAGLVEPTPQERAEMERSAAEGERRRAARAEILEAAWQALAELDESLARAILDLHREDHGECDGCDFDGREAERPEWPCRTVNAVAAHFGIQMELP